MSETPDLPPEISPPAARLASRLEPTVREQPRLRRVLAQLADLDLAIYRAVAVTPPPDLDEPMRRLSELADHSKLWLGTAAVMATVGGRTGRRVAAAGVA